MFYCYFVSIVYSSLDVFYTINILFDTSFYVACAFVMCLLKCLLTYLKPMLHRPVSGAGDRLV